MDLSTTTLECDGPSGQTPLVPFLQILFLHRGASLTLAKPHSTSRELWVRLFLPESHLRCISKAAENQTQIRRTQSSRCWAWCPDFLGCPKES